MIFEMYLLYTPFTSPSDPQVDVESLFATITKMQVMTLHSFFYRPHCSRTNP